MYRKSIIALLLSCLTFCISAVCAKELKVNRIVAKQAFQIEYMDESVCENKNSFFGAIQCVSSGQRVVDYEILEQKMEYRISEKDYEALLRIVEAEAGGEDENGKLLVANVVLNRLNNDKFPNTVLEVVMQREQGIAQFSPTVDGRYQSVTISDETVDAVERALCGEDISEGALYFCARKSVSEEKIKWFDCNLKHLFTYGNHDFFL